MSHGILSSPQPRRRCVSAGQIVCLSILTTFTTLLTFTGTSAPIAAGIAISLFGAVLGRTVPGHARR
ncbi:hypothetical protein [Amycolatopsis alba]|uniref:Uncharacterized protein n=1 Tax=Amycolatopsis alba DSM 44262 TaxID=1125972 RepID=A0A229S503_AMYAL|nr:hypothetical protein [Amycolatopsis alba]OXM53905.1 hypothetical protein CFP75_05960 [Amycolatopsis alba DSM 44262]